MNIRLEGEEVANLPEYILYLGARGGDAGYCLGPLCHPHVECSTEFIDQFGAGLQHVPELILRDLHHPRLLRCCYGCHPRRSRHQRHLTEEIAGR